MEFDEYEYLEKTVEEMDTSNVSSSKNKDGKQEKSGKESRRKELHEEDDGEDLRVKERRKKKKSSHDDNRGETRDREERERSSLSDRHRRSSKGSERETEREKDKDRRRSSRDVGRDSDRDSGSREKRDKYKDRDREKERETERSRRSRSHSRLDREREKELFRERELESELRESRRFKDKKDATEPETDPERDQRTVFAYQMPLKATERDVYEFFSKAGKVRDVRLIMDRNSRRSKGVGYIEFYDAMSVPMAITFCGQLLLGQPIMVKPSEAEKNLVQSNTTAAGPGGLAGPYGAADRKLYVGNLHFNMTEFQLKQIFEAFGPVELVQLPTDPETGHCKGFGFIQFAQIEHAKAAQSLNGKLEIAGRNIKVSLVTDHVTAQDSGAKAADFDDDDGGGLALNAQSRAMLMQKLDRTGIASSIVGAVGAPMLNGAAPDGLPLIMPAGIQALPPQILAALAPAEPIGNPTECLLLKNMFDPNMEKDPEFDLEIAEDVKEECSNYGRVKHIYVDKKSVGYVYLRFDSVEGATRAQQAMHKRWFARRLIAAIFLQPYEYDAKFKSAA